MLSKSILMAMRKKKLKFKCGQEIAWICVLNPDLRKSCLYIVVDTYILGMELHLPTFASKVNITFLLVFSSKWNSPSFSTISTVLKMLFFEKSSITYFTFKPIFLTVFPKHYVLRKDPLLRAWYFSSPYYIRMGTMSCVCEKDTAALVEVKTLNDK